MAANTVVSLLDSLGESTLNVGLWSVFIARVQGAEQGSCELSADGMKYVYLVGEEYLLLIWGGRKGRLHRSGRSKILQ